MSSLVSADGILQQLSELWIGLSKQGQAETGMGVLRACSLTLVIVTEGTEDMAALNQTIKALLTDHPARIIVISVDEAAREISAHVTAQCWKPFDKRRQICCEQIEIRAPETAVEDAAGVVSAIEVPDLPVVAWCRNQRVLERFNATHLAGMACKLVVDTRNCADPKRTLERLAALAAAGSVVGDLSWTYLTRWREALSHIFENRLYTARLREISELRVRFGGTGVIARYMGAWLKNALADAGVTAELIIEPGAKSAAVELKGAPFRVELTCRGEYLTTSVAGISCCTNLRDKGDHSLVSEELRILRRDPIFERTLATAARL